MTDLPTLIIEGPSMGQATITGTTSGLQMLVTACQRAIRDRVVMEDFNDHCDSRLAEGFTLVVRCNENAGVNPTGLHPLQAG
jgi:hypothetical protein